MSDSDDDMPMIARRRPQADAAPSSAVAAEPAKAAGFNGPKQQAPAAATAPAVKAEEGSKAEVPEAANVQAEPAPAMKEPAPAVKQESAPTVQKEAKQDVDSSSDDDDDDQPLGARIKIAENQAASKSADKMGVKTEKQQQANGVAAANGTAAKCRSISDGGTKKPAAAASGSRKQQARGKHTLQQQEAANEQTKPTAQKKAAAAAKEPAKGKAAASSDAAGRAARVKKEYDLLGQTRDTPDEADPLRKFYTSLLREKPESAMAKKWCVMHGLLPAEEAEDWVRQNKSGKTSTSTPIKAAAKRPSSAPAKRAAAAEVGKGRPAKKAAAAAGGSAGKPKPKPKQVKRVSKKDRPDWEDDDSDDNNAGSDSSDDDVPLAKRKAKA